VTPKVSEMMPLKGRDGIRMKKYWLLVFLSLFLLLTACAPIQQEPSQGQSAQSDEQSSDASTSNESRAPAFQLEQLPDLPAYAGLPKEIYTRYSKEAYVDTLRPASDYGQLYPYIGKVVIADFFALELRYGLADAQGRIVVDPVYSGASYISTGPEQGVEYLCLTYPIDKIGAAAKEAGDQTGYYDMRRRFQFAKADGSWVSPLYYGDSATLSGDRVYVSLRSDAPEDRWSDTGTKYQLYDLNGNLIAEGDGILSGFSDGLFLLWNTQYKDGGFYQNYSYIDKNGYTAIAGPFSSAVRFKNGRALVQLESGGLVAAIDTQGNYVAGPIRLGDSFSLYDSDYYDFNYQTFRDNGREGMIDRAGNIVLPAVYDAIYSDFQERGSAVVTETDGVYEYIDLQTGLTAPVEGSYSSIYPSENGWMIAYRMNWYSSMNNPHSGYYLIRGEKNYPFLESEYGSVHVVYVANDIFAVNSTGNPYGTRYTVSFFDAGSGETVKTFQGWNYSGLYQTPQGPVYYLKNEIAQKAMVLSQDFEPLFSKESLAGADAFSDIIYLSDGIFSVRTERYGGLMRMDGSWLIRVIAEEQD